MTVAWVEGPEEPLSEAAAEAYVASTCFKTGPPGLLGLELEFVVVPEGDASVHVDHDRVSRILGSLPPLPAAGTLTLEPGGQVELSTRIAPDLVSLLADAHADLAVLRAEFRAAGLELVGTGLDQLRAPRRVLEHPRYVEMERYFDRWGASGRTMMCSTAAVQLTVEAGLDDDGSPAQAGHRPDGYLARWDLLHRVGPTLVAAFANSPLRAGVPTGWKSSRQQAWLGFDPSRTASVHRRGTATHPREVYAAYALDAGLLLVRGDGLDWRAPVGLTFRDWVRGAWREVDGLRPPRLADLDYHLTTLFPPVRARGPLEVRYLDGQADDAWRVPAAVLTALLDDHEAGDQARAATEAVVDCWEQAARCGPADSELAKAATACLSAAVDGLDRLGAPRDVVDDVAAFVERYPLRGRCPADDQLDHGAPHRGADLRERQTC